MAIGTISNGDTGAAARTKINSGLQAIDSTPKNNVAATVPGATNDSSAGQGYSVNSKWFNSALGIEYLCRDATVGAAVWVRQDNADFYGYVSGRYYWGILGQVAAGTASGGNQIKLHPVIIKERVTISELASRVATADASGSVQFAVYATDPTTKMPTGVPLGSTGSISTTPVGPITGALGASLTLEPGMYWFAMNTNSATVVFQVINISSNNLGVLLGGTAAQVSSATTGSMAHLAIAQTFGTWPDLTAASFTIGNSGTYAAIFFKVA
jgi:hypothetical protein